MVVIFRKVDPAKEIVACGIPFQQVLFGFFDLGEDLIERLLAEITGQMARFDVEMFHIFAPFFDVNSYFLGSKKRFYKFFLNRNFNIFL